MAVRTKAALETQLTTLLADNTSGDISAADVRAIFQDVFDSLIFPADLQDEIDDVTGLGGVADGGRRVDPGRA